MTQKKQTMYDILAVAPTASYADINAAYQELLQKLASQKERFSREDYDFKVKVIHVAFNTLSTPSSRDAYDAKLGTFAVTAEGAANSTATLTANALAVAPDAASLALRAEAMSLRADAMSLRAEAMSIRAGVAPFNLQTMSSGPDRPPSAMEAAFSKAASPMKRVLVILGTLLATGMVIQVAFLLMANKRGEVDPAVAAKQSEKVMIEEYYQSHGVRVSSMAELERLEVANRALTSAQNEQRAAERDKEKAKDQAQKFEDDARRRGDQVSAELRYAEDRAREQGQREDERKKMQLEDDKRRKDEAQRNRIEQEQEKWNAILKK